MRSSMNRWSSLEEFRTDTYVRISVKITFPNLRSTYTTTLLGEFRLSEVVIEGENV